MAKAPKLWDVYGLIDPRDNCVFYVGMSSRVSLRLPQHLTDPASPAYGVLSELSSVGMKMSWCLFGSNLDKASAKILEGRLILALPNVVNAKTYHALPSDSLNWRFLEMQGRSTNMVENVPQTSHK